MANYTTTQDLLADVLWRAYENTDGSSQYKDAALRYLNRAYRSLWMGGSEFMPGMPTNWWWLREQASIIMQPVYETGTISVTNDSDIGVLSVAPSISIQGYHFIGTGGEAVYTIAEHAASDIGLLFDSVYVGATDTALAYKAMPLDYALPSDCLKIIDPMITHRNDGARVYGVGMSEMWDEYPIVDIALGTPRKYAPVDESNIRFSHYLDEQARFDFFYLAEPAVLTDDSSSIPLVPLNYRHVLADMATFFVMTDKEEARAPGIGQQAKALIAAMAKENDLRWAQTGTPGQIKPRRSNAAGFRRSSSGLRLWWGR